MLQIQGTNPTDAVTLCVWLLPHRRLRENAELDQDRGNIITHPSFGNLSLGKSVQFLTVHHHGFACGRNAHQRSIMSSPRRKAIGHHVAFSDEVFNRQVKIGKGRTPHADDPFEALRSSRKISSAWNVNLIIGREMFVGNIKVAFVQPFVDQMADKRFVFLG